MRTVVKYLPLALFVALFAGWALFLRPTALGGPATYTIVSGSSMEPTLHAGDLIVTRTADAYAPGDVVTYVVPDGQVGGTSGAAIVHRIIEARPDGRFVTRGDNLEGIDPWTPSPQDVTGALWLHLPGAGNVLLVLLSPAVVGSVAGGLAAGWAFLRVGRRPEPLPA